MSVWKREDILLLISAVKQRPATWNVRNPAYREREQKLEAWAQVAEILERTVHDVEKKFHSLRTQFTAELRARERAKLQGKTRIIKWQYFQELLFLQTVTRVSKRGPYKKFPITSITYTKLEDEEDSDEDNDVMSQYPTTKRKEESSQNAGDTLHQAVKALKTLMPTRDDSDVFAQYIAVELRSFTDEHIRRKVKRDIVAALLAGQELEEGTWNNTCVTTSQNQPIMTTSETPTMFVAHTLGVTPPVTQT